MPSPSAIPSFAKGDFVTPAPREEFTGELSGFRDMTSEEKEAWYADPANQGIGDDGETKIHSGTFYQKLPEGTQMIVVRARATGRCGWITIGNCCEVKVLATGELLLVERKYLVAIK